MREAGQCWKRAATGLAVLACIGVTGCKSGSTPAAEQLTTPASIQVASSSAPRTPSGSPEPSASGGIQNLDVSASVRTELTAAFVAYKQIEAADVAGTAPSSVYYAYNPATHTYWAMARFLLSAKAPQNVQVNFQDGGDAGLFTHTGTAGWEVQIAGEPGICAELRFFPKAVLGAWALPATPPAGMCG